MSGTKQGGLKARDTNKQRHGDNFYASIGAVGGKASGTGGFYANRDLARRAGRLGGTVSKRGVWTKEQKQQAARKRAQREFQTSFNEPSFREKLVSKLRREQ